MANLFETNSDPEKSKIVPVMYGSVQIGEGKWTKGGLTILKIYDVPEADILINPTPHSSFDVTAEAIRVNKKGK